MDPPRSETCLSESTSIVSVSNSPLEIQNQHEEEVEKGHQEESNLVLDLSLRRSDSKSELNLIESFHHNTNSPSSYQGNEAEPRVFSCNYCQRKFYSSQALGGHQNAHKRERTMAKHGKRFASTSSFALSYINSNRYPSLASLPLHGSLSRSLGIQVHSMIHKPSFGPSKNSCNGRNGVWSCQVIDKKPAIGKLPPENFHVGKDSNHGSSSSSSSSDGVARFKTSSSRFASVNEGMGGFWWDNGANHLKTKQDDLKKLDLSLKL